MSSKDENDNKEKASDNNIDKTLDNNSNEKNDNDNTLLNKKTKRDPDSIDDEELSEDKNKQKKLEEENESKKIIEYEYGYIIQFLENGEKGLMEDFLPKISESSDYFNYGLTKEEFDKMVHDSLLYHYEQHLIEEKEKRDKMNMIMFNMNINMKMNNMGNNFLQRGMSTPMAQMNNFLMNNINYNANNNENSNNNINRNNTDNKQ
jgi:hypothetical protein